MAQVSPPSYIHPIWLSPNYVVTPATQSDLIIASLAFGFVLGFGFLTGRNAYILTSAMRNPKRSPFAWMVWGELVAIFGMAIQGFLLVIDAVQASLWYYLAHLCIWVFQIHLILQIICNRVAILDCKHARLVRWSVFVYVSMINISVFCIWVPGHMQISQRYIAINHTYDRITKVLFLLVDFLLNFYFIRNVKAKLLHFGMRKYDKLVRFNLGIVIFSVSLDCVLVAAMSLSGLMYAIIQCGVYVIKLNIELSLASLIIFIATEEETDVWLSYHEALAEGAATVTQGIASRTYHVRPEDEVVEAPSESKNAATGPSGVRELTGIPEDTNGFPSTDSNERSAA